MTDNATLTERSLDKDVGSLLLELAALQSPAVISEGLGYIREAMKLMTAVSQTTDVASVVDQCIGSDAIPVRIYRPQLDAKLPVVIFYHGGGWALCNIDTHDEIARQIAVGANCVVVSVDYRLAPEHKFPAAVDDAYNALCWVSEHAEELGIDVNRIAVAGDSAGANLAAVTAIKSRDLVGPPIYMQCLIYPVTDVHSMETESYREFADHLNLTRSSMQWFKQLYLDDVSDAADPMASPLLCQDLSGLPLTYIVSAGFDVLRDEAKAYADKLSAANNLVQYTEFSSLVHGFMAMTERAPAAQFALNTIVKTLKNTLHDINCPDIR